MKKTLLQIAKYYHPVEGGIETVTKYMAEGLSRTLSSASVMMVSRA